MMQNCRKYPGVSRHIRHLSIGRKRQVILARQRGSISQATYQVFHFQCSRMCSEREGMRHQVTTFQLMFNTQSAFGRLSVPQHLLQRPAGNSPGKLSILQFVCILIHYIHSLVDHGGTVFMYNISCQCRIANVEMAFKH